ncbi:MAG: serpin family protein [Bacteroidales bacterium]|nr:serpin family protein [Bacteroidales bacterium]
MKHFYMLAAIAAFMMMTATSCDKVEQGDNGDNEYKPLELTTKASQFVEQGSTFSFEFIDRINKHAKADYIISPLSMQFLLGMLLDGAKGETAEQIAKVLGYGAGEVDAVNQFCLSMLEQLPKLDEKTTLNIANAIFVDDGWPLNSSFKKDVAKYFNAEVSNLDFSDNAGSLKVINGWSNTHTNGMIPKVLEEVDPSILAYLMNAVYFKSQWVNQFPKQSTADELFTDETGMGINGKVKMMKMSCHLPYFENEMYQMVSMPYGNGAFSMMVLLPRYEYTTAEITASLKKANWNALRKAPRETEVDVWFPKFESKYKIKLNDILSAMGMPLAFGAADFSAMSPYANRLSFVQQDGAIKVDEEGSEAAAVSVAGMEKNTAVGGEPQIAIFHADHPFIYLITEASTGVVLFAGRYCGK